MNRRNFIMSVGTMTLLSGGGYFAFHQHFASHNEAKRIIMFDNLYKAMQELDSLRTAMNKIDLTGNWTLHQHLLHCSQSVEFSMKGFPEEKPALFQQTIGKLIFSQFENQGYMRHNRNEPIPKAPDLIANGDIQAAFDRLQKALVDFDNFKENLFPHFAYGILSKKEYEKAHIMHLADHFSIMTY
jgi:hypothetical protein